MHLTLKEGVGEKDDVTGISGSYFAHGSYGLNSLGNGQYYISHASNTSAGQTATLKLYNYTGGEDVFELADAILYGDVNADGKVNLIDSIILSRNIADWAGYGDSTIDTAAADVDADGELTPADVTILVRHLANWSGYDTLPKEN